MVMRAVLLVAVLAAPAALDAQMRGTGRFAMVDSGSAVRVGVTERVRRRPMELPAQRVEGTVRRITPDTLYLQPLFTADTLAVARALIQGVELSLGRPSRLRSAAEWASSGAILFALLAPNERRRPDGTKYHSWGRAFENAGIGLGTRSASGRCGAW